MPLTRRRCVHAWALGLLLPPHALRAQTAAKVHRVGILRPSAPPFSPTDPIAVGIPNALRDAGYVEGRNLVIERRWAGGDLDRLPALARELVQAGVDVIIAVGAPAVQAAKAATPAVPIILYGNFDPLALGLVDSLARPAGNVTGVLIAPDGTLAGKRLELLKAAVPTARRVALLVPEDEAIRVQVQETRAAAQQLGIELSVVVVRSGDYTSAFATIARERVAGLVVGSHQYFVRDRAQIIALAAQYKLPAIYEWREQVVDGGLMTYSTSLNGLYERIASYVDRILKGAKPGDLPVERPTRFELVINLKTAKALGLIIPQALRLRADEVIE
jgi:putative tryptophan/tyrosine transport system substrate-binding protein